MQLVKYPIGMADFEGIREGNYVYVDKTEYVHALASQGIYYFLGRPRRFGKSLFLNTLEAYFQGKRHLFKGLAIDRLEPQEWETFPVIHLDLTGKAYTDKDSLAKMLEDCLEKIERQYGLKKIDKPFDLQFQDLIETLKEKTGRKVVVLIDEYDSPLSDVIGNPELFDHYRQQLHGFYSVLKKAEKCIRFCMLTGVTKFGKVSVFSGLNNLRDISFQDDYAGICGITKSELYDYFKPGVELLAQKMHVSLEEAFIQLKYHYDGYHFSAEMLDIYNPYSLLNALADRRIYGYWCASGVPTILSKTLHNLDFDLTSVNNTLISQEMLENLSAYHTDPIGLLYQTGYLTIKGYNPDYEEYTLGYPNREVEKGILANILSVYAPESRDVPNFISRMRKSLQNGLSEEFIEVMSAFLSGIPYSLGDKVSKYEKYYHTVFYCIMTLLGMQLKVDYPMAEGRPDVVVETDNYIYIIELKINGDAASAMRQIEERHYADPFAADPRSLIKIGIGFSPPTPHYHQLRNRLNRLSAN